MVALEMGWGNWLCCEVLTRMTSTRVFEDLRLRPALRLRSFTQDQQSSIYHMKFTITIINISTFCESQVL
jgi:hypothetical protein